MDCSDRAISELFVVSWVVILFCGTYLMIDPPQFAQKVLTVSRSAQTHESTLLDLAKYSYIMCMFPLTIRMTQISVEGVSRSRISVVALRSVHHKLHFLSCLRGTHAFATKVLVVLTRNMCLTASSHVETLSCCRILS